MGKERTVMILERSDSALSVQKQGNSYILEGVVAEFGKKNNNNRIYEESEYLPHLEELKKQIQMGSLYGELDHPEKFDISLTKVSHLIESLEYDKDRRQVKGRIRLLNTRAGKDAQAILDDGGLLSISSRAAGTVSEDSKVKIKKMFTYDLVANPGFSSATLKRINESLGYDPDDYNLSIYDMSEKYGDMFNDDEVKKETKKETKINMSEQQFVTAEVLHKYSEYIKEKFEEIESLLKNHSGNTTSNMDIQNLKEYVQYLGEQTQALANQTEKQNKDIIEHNNYLAENMNKIIEYNDYLAENLDSNILESSNIIKYTEYLGKKLDEGIQYSEYIKENAENIISHNNYLAEKLNQNINYSEYLGKKVNENINYSEYLGKKVNENINYSDYVGKKVNENINYTEYLGKKVNENINYSDYLGETLNQGINENYIDPKRFKTENVLKSTERLSSKVDSILESIKRQKNEDQEYKKQIPYLNLLNENKQREFTLLSADQKQQVMNEVNKVKPINEAQFVQVWNNALSPKHQQAERLTKVLDEMPEKIRPIWEMLSESQRDTILKQASYYTLDTSYQIKNFWNTRKGLNEAIELQRINESVDPNQDKVKIQTTGYGDSYMNQIVAGLGRYN